MTDRPAASPSTGRRDEDLVESRYAWMRLAASVLISTIGGVGMWSIIVAMPAIQAEFGVARAGASLPYSLNMIGFMFGTVIAGKIADRFGIMVPVLIGIVMLFIGYVATAYAPSIGMLAVLYAVFIGLLGSSVTFAPLIADSSLWFDKRRGIAISLCASGSYLAGTVWPPVIEHFIATIGWRQTHIGIGFFCLATMFPLTLMLRRRPP